MPRPDIVIERVLPAPPSTVFEQWSVAESMARWMCPAAGMTRASVELDFRVGGRFEIVMHGERDYRQTGEFLEIVRDRRIVFSWISDWMPAHERATLVRVELEPCGADETRLVLTHTSLPDGDAYDGHAGGWGKILDLLSEIVANPRGGNR
jgi:uncharacterized protein YndB with AHSA1/START domain